VAVKDIGVATAHDLTSQQLISGGIHCQGLNLAKDGLSVGIVVEDDALSASAAAPRAILCNPLGMPWPAATAVRTMASVAAAMPAASVANSFY